jgi:hypothetical protein
MVRIHPDPPSQRGCSSVGRAPALQAGGRRFDPVQLHQSGDREQGAGNRRRQRQAERLTSGFLVRRYRLFFNNMEEVKVLLGERGAALCGVLQKSEIGLDCIDWFVL